MNTKLHAISGQNGRPLSVFMTAGQISDDAGAAALLDSLPAAQWMLGDRGYDGDWFRDALEEKEIKPGILGRKSRGKPVKYDRCPTVFFSAICLAATVMFWLCILSLIV